MLFDGNLMCLKPQMDDFQGKYNLMQRDDSFEKTLMLERLSAGEKIIFPPLQRIREKGERERERKIKNNLNLTQVISQSESLKAVSSAWG